MTDVAWLFFASIPSFSSKGTAAIPPPEPKSPLRTPLVSPTAADLRRCLFSDLMFITPTLFYYVVFVYICGLNVGIHGQKNTVETRICVSTVHLYLSAICRHFFKYLICTPEEIITAYFLFKSAALEHFRNSRVYAGEIDFLILRHKLVAKLAESIYT